MKAKAYVVIDEGGTIYGVYRNEESAQEDARARAAEEDGRMYFFVEYTQLMD